MATYQYKRLATGVSEYVWSGVSSGALCVSDPRDGEVIIQIAWDKNTPPTDEQKKILLNVYLYAFYKGARHGAEKKQAEIRAALGLEE